MDINGTHHLAASYGVSKNDERSKLRGIKPEEIKIIKINMVAWYDPG